MLGAVPNPVYSRKLARGVADRDRATLLPLTAMVTVARVLVVLRRSGV